MSGMRRVDRKSGSDDNAINNPRSQNSEPLSYHELKQHWLSARSTQNELRDIAKTKEQEAEHTHRLYLEEQQRHQTALTLYQEVQQNYQTTLTQYEEVQIQARSYLIQYEKAQTQAKSYFTQYQDAQTQVQSYSALYQESQTQFQSYLTLYESEKTRGDELSVKFEEIQAERDRYLTLYNESQNELKFERRSKAGIKGWETRRKRENERLKQEIGEMTVLLRDSLERKEEAVNSLYVVAERMDRIQRLVDSVDDDAAANPVGMIQKLQRIWQTVKEILAE
ncbi:MAG: hypothetical protein KME10_13210 [Plectolyngbya sp. WJT66-NPBG17]|jgi:chromosome segregation ATPase|nr:hypothetical protein [Plectolyngbya sp. WJT66-NPBG17]MBW4525853.1 hypothetical protein [Phormidium tanganyikae FI6-MK23]